MIFFHSSLRKPQRSFKQPGWFVAGGLSWLLGSTKTNTVFVSTGTDTGVALFILFLLPAASLLLHSKEVYNFQAHVESLRTISNFFCAMC